MHINNSCWTLYENAEEREILECAAGWMKTVTDQHPIWMYLDTYAALLFKAGDLDQAEKVAIFAVQKGKAEGEKGVKTTEELLEKIRNSKKGF